MKSLLPLTKRDKQVASTVCGYIEAFVSARAMNYRKTTLTHKELHALSIQIQQLQIQLGATK